MPDIREIIDKKVHDNFENVHKRLELSFQAIKKDMNSIKDSIKEVKEKKELDLEAKLNSLRDSITTSVSQEISSLKKDLATKEDFKKHKEEIEEKINKVRKEFSEKTEKNEIKKELSKELSKDIEEKIERNLKNFSEKVEELKRGLDEEFTSYREKAESQKQEILEETRSKVLELKREIAKINNSLGIKIDEKDKKIEEMESEIALMQKKIKKIQKEREEVALERLEELNELEEDIEKKGKKRGKVKRFFVGLIKFIIILLIIAGIIYLGYLAYIYLSSLTFSQSISNITANATNQTPAVTVNNASQTSKFSLINFLIGKKEFNYFYDIGSTKDKEKPYLIPDSRISDALIDKNTNITYREITGNLVYFSIPIPFSADKIKVDLAFKEEFPRNAVMAVGAKISKDWNYSLVQVFSRTNSNYKGEWIVRTAEFNVSSVYKESGKLSMLINVPHLASEDNANEVIPLDYINVTVIRNSWF